MKITRSLRIGQALAGIALAALGSSAFATSTWDLSTGCSGANGSGTNLGTSVVCGGSATGTTIYGYSTGAVTTPTTTTNFVASSIYTWGSAGLGIVAPNENAGDTGPHAIDNAKGTDAMMIKFTGGPVSLSGVTIGWNGTDNGTTTNGITYNDSDISVLAYTGSNPVVPNVTGASLSTLLSTGWTLVSNLTNVGSITSPTNTGSISSTIYSSYWLISAYSSSYGGSALDGSIDAFKLLTVAGCTSTDTSTSCKTTHVPEPGSLALLGAGLFGVVAIRRRRSALGA